MASEETEYKVTAEFYAEFNRLRAKVDSMGGEDIHNTPNSLHVSPNTFKEPKKPVREAVKLKIVSSADGSGRYLAKILYGTTNNDPDNLTETDFGNLSTNLVEVWDISQIGNYTLGFLNGYNKTTGKPIYVTTSNGVAVRISSNTGMGGQYQGYIQVGSATDAALDGLTDGPMCIIINGPERGDSSSLPLSQNGIIVPGVVVGTDEESSMAIVLVSAFSDQFCNS